MLSAESMGRKRVKRSWVVLGAAALLLGCATEKEPTPAEQRAAAGRELYQTFCIACHGANGGGGVLAAYLAPPPPDLRSIAARRGGRFPYAQVEAWIDGRDQIPSHGTREMPAWGPNFREETWIDEGTETRVHERISALVAYLESIQQP
jgi:mono/diheme cytochrome c family protein